MNYFDNGFAERMPSKKLWALLDGPPRRPDEPVTARHELIAAAVQVVTEEAVFSMLRHLRGLTKSRNVVLSGGVALNSVLNAKIPAQTGFENVWIQPNAGDGGSSMGAALYAWHSVLGNPRKYSLTSPFLGPEYSADDIAAFLQGRGIIHRRFATRGELLAETARRIADNQVVGWFQGRMEWGPRALGARSILGNASNPAMRDILNLKVKHREAFRPFAPAVRAEDAPRYFECPDPVPVPAEFMLVVYPVRAQWREQLGAVTHVDGTGRLQAVRRETNPLFYDLIGEVAGLTGVGAVINTSFNVRGEPIVRAPEEAYRCMMGTGIDCLMMGEFLILRKDNLKDAWDSESSAKD
jgi:carbamoyltransferase